MNHLDSLPSGKAAPAHLPRLAAVRTLAVLAMAMGYASTMARGPGTAEWGRIFGYEPSMFAVQTLFFLSGWLALRSLHRHGSGLRMLASRARRNLPALAVATAIVALLVYPLISPTQPMGIADRMQYIAMTVSCADPGRLLPGALDEAHYACLLQGAVWTFRWGAIAFLGTALIWPTGLLRSRLALVFATSAAVAAYAVLNYLSQKAGTWELLTNAETGLRFAYPFAAGMLAFAWGDRLRALPMAGALVGLATVNFWLLPWTPLIEIGTALAFGLGALTLARSRHPALSSLDGWPALALPVFVVNWPVAQVWLYALPEIGSAGLVALTLTTSLLLAGLYAALLGGSKRAFRPPAFSHANAARTP